MRFLFILIFALPTIAYASCPQITIDGSETASVKLPSSQASCSAADVFTCARGSLRINGRVDSLSNGSVQLSAFCHLEKDEQAPAENFTDTDSSPSSDETLSGEEDLTN